ncbi:MAG: AraC family transcriptional regulator [Spirochaetales bacterium]
MRIISWKHRQRTVLYKYFSVILAICAAILIVSTIASFRIIEEIVVEQVYQNSVEQLEQVRSVFDAVHYSVIPATVQLTEDRLVTALMYSGELSYAEVLQAMGRLDTAKLSNPLIDSIVVYNHLTRRFYTTEKGIIHRDSFFDRELVQMLDNARHYGLYRYIPRQIGGRSIFTLLLGSPPIVGTSLKGAMTVNISERALRNLFASSAGEFTAELRIYDRHGTVLSHPDPQRFGVNAADVGYVSRLLEITDENGVFFDVVGGRRCLVTYVRNTDFGWTFVSATPYESIFSDVIRTRNTVLALLAGLFVFSVVAAFIASRRLYRPIDSMRSYARRLEHEFLPSSDPDMGDELEYVDAVLHRMHLKAQTLSDSVSRHRSSSLREATRTAILSGSVEPVIAAGEVDSDERCRVVVALLDSATDVHLRHAYQEVVATLNEYATELAARLQSELPGVEIEPDHVAVLLTNVSHPCSDTDEIKDELSSLTTWESDLGALTFSIGVGLEVTGLADIAFSYRSAVAAARRRFRHGPGAIYTATERESNAEASYLFPDAAADRLVRAVRAAERSQAVELLDGMLEEVKHHEYEDFLLLAHLLLHKLSRTTADAYSETCDPTGSLAQIRARLVHFESVSEASGFFHAAIVDLCDSHVCSTGQKKQELAQGALDAIHANLTDPNLSSTWIADRLTVSTNYLRAVFREINGVSVSDYTNARRIELCKERLERADVQVKELYGELGFGSYNYFFSLFRKHTGMTPLQYRRRLTGRRLS